MKRTTILSILLVIWTLAVSAKDGGHFWLRLGGEHIAMDKAVSRISEWQSVADGSTFQLLRDETDALGMRHMRYRQWVLGGDGAWPRRPRDIGERRGDGATDSTWADAFHG